EGGDGERGRGGGGGGGGGGGRGRGGGVQGTLPRAIRRLPGGNVPTPWALLPTHLPNRRSSRAGPAQSGGLQRHTPPNGPRKDWARVHRRQDRAGEPQWLCPARRLMAHARTSLHRARVDASD